MQAYKDLAELTFNLNDNQDDVFKLLELIKPAWNKEQVKIKVLTGGNSCHMLRCTEAGESVTMRARNHLEGLRDPKFERQIVNVMSSKGYFSPVLAVFQNGFCYEYIAGMPVCMKGSAQLSIDDDQLRLIAHGMANIHSVAVPGFDYNQTSLFDFFVTLVPDSKACFKGSSSKEELIQEIRLVEELVSVVRSPLVHIHGDAHPANMVWNEKQKKITFVDWELSQVAPRAYDVAYFLNSLDFLGYIRNIPVVKPKDIERKFCTLYLKQWNELSNNLSPTEEELEQLLLELKYFTLVVNIVWMIYTVRFYHVLSPEGTFESYWQFFFNRYISSKGELLGIKKLGLPHTDSKCSK